MGLFSRLFGKKEEPPAVVERNALNIQVGDIVTYDLADYEVVGKITYRQDYYEWFSYQLLDGKTIIWLSAEMDDELELGIYKSIPLDVSSPYPRKLSYQGKNYTMMEEGEARVVGEGRSRNINSRITHYADYEDADEENFLSLEDWGSEIEVSLGHAIDSFEIKIMAGSNS